MRKITAQLCTSVDGVVEAPETWHLDFWNYQMEAAVGTISPPSSNRLVGPWPCVRCGECGSSGAVHDDRFFVVKPRLWCGGRMSAARHSVLVQIDQIAARVVHDRVHSPVVHPGWFLDEHHALGLEPLGVALAVVGAQ